MAGPRAANRAEPRQRQEHQEPTSPRQQPADPTRKLRSPSPGLGAPLRLTSLSPVLIRAPELKDSEPKPILFQSDFVPALFASKNLSPALSSYRWERATGVGVDPEGSPGRAAALVVAAAGYLCAVCLPAVISQGLGCSTPSRLAWLFPRPPRNSCCSHGPSELRRYF